MWAKSVPRSISIDDDEGLHRTAECLPLAVKTDLKITLEMPAPTKADIGAVWSVSARRYGKLWGLSMYWHQPEAKGPL